MDYLWAPGKFHSHCGRELANDVFCKMNKKLDIEAGKTPAESPFSNGELERNNKVLCEGLMKTMEDAKCDIRQL